MMKWEGDRRKRSWLTLRSCDRIFLWRLRETRKYLRNNSRSLGPNCSPGPPDYDVGMLTAVQQHSVTLGRPVSGFQTSCVYRH
jgi:hypothetical protein